MAKRKPQCKAPITPTTYDRICALYTEYQENKKNVHGMHLGNIYALHHLMNDLFGLNKSERTLRRIYRGEYPRELFE